MGGVLSANNKDDDMTDGKLDTAKAAGAWVGAGASQADWTLAEVAAGMTILYTLCLMTRC